MALVAVTMAAMATDYTDKLRVMLNDSTVSASTNTATLDVKDAAKGTYTLRIKNVTYKMMGQTIGIGTIVVDNLKGELMPDGATRLSAKTVKVEKGDDPNVQYWMGAMSFLPIVGSTDGRLDDDNFYCVTSFNLIVTSIKLVFGDGGFQIANSDFEAFHETSNILKKVVEPNRWHSLATAQGLMAGATLLAAQSSFQSDDTRPGSKGSHSAVIVSSDVIGLGANGVLTTGRVKAASAFATSTSNHQYIDLTDEDKDDNGDPFYTKLNACPDSIAFWVRFKQGPLSSKNQKYNTAMMHAIVTDGTLYQDPENTKQTYTNVVAKAIDNDIESNDTWTRVCLPFDYASFADNQAKARALLVTFSTNAQPGVASSDGAQRDSLWVDDLELIYRADVTGISVKGTPVDGFSADKTDYSLSAAAELAPDDIAVDTQGQGALVTKTLTKTFSGMKATIEVMSADYQTTHTYTLNIKGATPTGIDSLQSAGHTDNDTYTLDGLKVKTPQKGTVYVQGGKKIIKR